MSSTPPSSRMQTPMSSRSSRVRKPVQHFGSLVSSDILSEGEEGGKADVPEEDSEDDFEMKDRDESDDERVEIQDESEEEAVPAGEDSEDELILKPKTKSAKEKTTKEKKVTKAPPPPSTTKVTRAPPPSTKKAAKVAPVTKPKATTKIPPASLPKSKVSKIGPLLAKKVQPAPKRVTSPVASEDEETTEKGNGDHEEEEDAALADKNENDNDDTVDVGTESKVKSKKPAPAKSSSVLLTKTFSATKSGAVASTGPKKGKFLPLKPKDAAAVPEKAKPAVKKSVKAAPAKSKAKVEEKEAESDEEAEAEEEEVDRAPAAKTVKKPVKNTKVEVSQSKVGKEKTNPAPPQAGARPTKKVPTPKQEPKAVSTPSSGAEQASDSEDEASVKETVEGREPETQELIQALSKSKKGPRASRESTGESFSPEMKAFTTLLDEVSNDGMMEDAEEADDRVVLGSELEEETQEHQDKRAAEEEIVDGKAPRAKNETKAAKSTQSTSQDSSSKKSEKKVAPQKRKLSSETASEDETPTPAQKKPAPAEKITPAQRVDILNSLVSVEFTKNVDFSSVPGSVPNTKLSRHWREVLSTDLKAHFGGQPKKAGGKAPEKGGISNEQRRAIWVAVVAASDKADWKKVEALTEMGASKLKRHLKESMKNEGLKAIGK